MDGLRVGRQTRVPGQCSRPATGPRGGTPAPRGRDDRRPSPAVGGPRSGRRRRGPRILLKARPTPAQLADRLAPPVPDGLELYIHEDDVAGAGWLAALDRTIGGHAYPPDFTWIVEGPVWSLDGELFGICRNAEPDRELTRRLVRLAAHLGAVAVNIHCVHGSPDHRVLDEAARTAALERAIPFLEWYAGLCRDAGVQPLIENVPPVCRMRRGAFIFTPLGVEPRDLEACVRAVPGLGLTLDTSHAQLAVNAFRGVPAPPSPPSLATAAAYYCDRGGPPTLAAYLEPLLPWTRSVHVSNAAGLLDEGLPYDAGDADLDAAVRLLARTAACFVTEPIDPDDDHAALKREIQQRLARVLGVHLAGGEQARGSIGADDRRTRSPARAPAPPPGRGAGPPRRGAGAADDGSSRSVVGRRPSVVPPRPRVTPP